MSSQLKSHTEVIAAITTLLEDRFQVEPSLCYLPMLDDSHKSLRVINDQQCLNKDDISWLTKTLTKYRYSDVKVTVDEKSGLHIFFGKWENHSIEIRINSKQIDTPKRQIQLDCDEIIGSKKIKYDDEQYAKYVDNVLIEIYKKFNFPEPYFFDSKAYEIIEVYNGALLRKDEIDWVEKTLIKYGYSNINFDHKIELITINADWKKDNLSKKLTILFYASKSEIS